MVCKIWLVCSSSMSGTINGWSKLYTGSLLKGNSAPEILQCRPLNRVPSVNKYIQRKVSTAIRSLKTPRDVVVVQVWNEVVSSEILPLAVGQDAD
jgi:hypothetical protein